ncbi:Ribosome production factor 1 [Yamadazyma tenuis]|uniref:Brix-domain-containing protein n=1 Tax=Candida tenuis (strain ATCC 10573 / BCRC 21748 / CBS 615 / JCM 9827 / NBRC 10315 / NRRL Y-1498 / VKM Y-70) TaxID=590646 RepID=G3BB02_CANTC|nr:Brix-domain-containing protein [Yamadazyma tenuis ATCC 10573]EGV61493.1 Brix-domain-containing protein [Yamadazyma tenuis ATCC 10573]WEJ92711.1 Ribosome production factor 1 [Yamadazyma tenuis]
MSEDTTKILKGIRNKQRRQKLYADLKHEKNKAKHKARAERATEERNDPSLKEQRLADNVPETLDSKRVYDETIVEDMEGEDEFDAYFASDKPPKLLLTTSKYAKKPAYEFADLLMDFLPDVTFVKRKPQFSINDMVKFCNNREYTDLVILNEFNKKVTGLTFIHLPEGPTFYFSITSVTEGKKIRGHGRSTDHTPELILNNFNTRLGKTVGRLFQSLFPKKPEFEGRQVITLHNQRDYIFFRRHRYLFKSEERVGLQEIGPQFTLKLRRLQKGIRDETEWEFRPEMEKDKRKFYL